MSRSSEIPAIRRLLLTAAVVAGCSLVGCSGGDAESSPPTSAVLAVAPESVRAAAVAAFAGLRDGPVATRTIGSAGGQNVEAEGAVDPVSMSMRLDETLNDVIRTEFVLTDRVLYARIYAATDEPPAFTVSEPGALEEGFYDEALTGSGRVFGDVDTISAVLASVPATVYTLGGRPGDAGTQTGYRFVFDAFDIGNLLIDERLEATVVLPEPGRETTSLEVWVDPALRELTTAGAVYQDGELIDDVRLTIEFAPVTDAEIAVPDDTLPR